VDRRAEAFQCLCITGPTACGKTDLALALAEDYPIEIVSMDSAMVYRGMDVGTAKPEADVLARVPHHLVDVCEPEEAYSAGRFAVEASRAIGEIRARGALPVLVGGTMLYLRALRDGIAPLPGRDPLLRAAIDREAEAAGWPALHARLAELDPAAAARIEPGDRQRIQRALEVHALTGRPLTELQAAAPEPRPVAIETLAVIPGDRAALALAIERRFQDMVERGFVDEVRRLRARPGLSAESAAMRAVGYRQIWAYLDGRWDWAEAQKRAVAATRQLAKRQMTWLRADTRSKRLAAGDPDLAAKLGACLGGATAKY
jgi:tRNA dimethylallyltransferase